ncbi:hypothetical protein MKW94_013624 [Papaver nudicaule]|uniref:Uncharacterized protein n=1 Tax=Papaver nudicaule TaxID=74823 RepID=A0AA41VRI0_PAPNU|nr:hypothetical protein [Papaver nudicaule]
MASTDQVRYVSASIVRPASCTMDTTDNLRIALTAWDLKLLTIQYIQRGLLFTKPKLEGSQAFSNMASNLKVSLSLALDHFVSLLKNTMMTEPPPLSTLTVILPGQSVSKPELTDGIFVGCSINHAVCDGTSFWHFMNSWSEIAISAVGGKSPCSIVLHPPILERCFLNNTNRPIRLPISVDAEHFQKSLVHRSDYCVRFYHFTRETIATLKAKANSEISPANGHGISSLQALLAHVWVAVTRARHLDPDEDVKYFIAVGNRTRLIPHLPQEYFGNSVQGVVATAKVRDLLERGPSWGALLLNQAIMSSNDTTIRCSWDSWVQKPAFQQLEFLFNSSSLLTGGSPRFNMYGNDFGWGQPIAVRSGVANKCDGKISVIPGLIEGSSSVEACLSSDTLTAMEDDTEFIKTISI